MNKKDTKKAVINGGRSSGRALKLLCELHETFRQVCELHEKQIAALERKLEQTEKDLADYQFNYPKIKELEQTNNNLLDVINNQDVKIADLEKQITKATELLNEFMRISKASDEDFEHDYSELIGETEQFIKDLEK